MHATTTWVSFYKQELSIIALASKFSGYAPASLHVNKDTLLILGYNNSYTHTPWSLRNL